jgi:Phage integrase, N-terminal SAM-like domain
MRGYVAKKGKRWYAVIYDGVNPATGKEQRRWVPAGTRRGDAEKLVTELVKRRNEGETVVTDKVTLGDYLVERWLPVQRTRLRASTYDSYRRNIELHVIPALGRRPLDKLTVEDLDLLYARLLVNGHKGDKGGGLSPKTVGYIHLIIRKALTDAHRKGTVVRNVATLADAPKVGARKRVTSRPGTPISSGSSSGRSALTGCTPRSTSLPTRACGVARCSASGGVTSISGPVGSRFARPWSPWRTTPASPT